MLRSVEKMDRRRSVTSLAGRVRAGPARPFELLPANICTFDCIHTLKALAVRDTFAASCEDIFLQIT